MFEYSSIMIKVSKQKKKPNKNKRARKYMYHLYHLMQFLDKALLNLPKNVGKMNQMARNIKFC